jgi:hypothetical protein
MVELSLIRDLVAIAGVIIALGYYIINIRNQTSTAIHADILEMAGRQLRR